MKEWLRRPSGGMGEGGDRRSPFQRRMPEAIPSSDAGTHDEPPIGAAPKDEDVRWDFILAIFLRLVALIWMLKGFANWALILGLGDLPLPEETQLRQAIIIAFAILDCAAAVGLWLLSPWGKSLWAFLVILEIALGITGYGRSVSMTAISTAFFTALLFLTLSFAARYASRQG